jgi:hypothetical protein
MSEVIEAEGDVEIMKAGALCKPARYWQPKNSSDSTQPLWLTGSSVPELPRSEPAWRIVL